MSDDAFPSSQAARRFAPLSEADYARMHDTLMETARGRWFLVEYARRNRNADTTMVLDAVARIERVVATQSFPSQAPSYLADAIRKLMQRLRDDVTADSAGDDAEANTQARRASRIIREIAWQMRECGNDPRICTILDAQLDAIDASIYAPPASRGTMLLDSIDGLIAQIDTVLADGVAAHDSTPHDEIAEDNAVLARIAAEMATDAPDADAFDEPPVRAATQDFSGERQRDSLGEMLIARGIIRAPGERDTPPDHQIN